MFLNKDKYLLVYLSEKSLTFFQHESQKSIVLDLAAEIFSDLEIKDKVKFTALLDTFIKQNKFADLNVILLLSPELCLSHRFATNNPKLSQEINLFVDSVPFETVASLNLNDTNKPTEILALTTNQELYSTVAEVLTKNNNSVLYIVPYQALYILGLPEKIIGFDQTVIQLIFGSLPQLKSYGFNLELITQTALNPIPKPNPTSEQKPKNQRLVLLIGVFAILLMVLGLLLASQGFF